MDREELRDRAIEQTRDKLKSAADRDRLMVKAINFLDENNNNFNAEMERFRDWYGLHFFGIRKGDHR